MTRREQIKNIAKEIELAEDDIIDRGLAKIVRLGFLVGAEWVDQHPHWIPVEERLPPLHYEGANSTDFVLIYDGGDVLIAYYNFKEKKWYNEQYGALIIPATHWMPLPQPPRKEE